MKILARVILSGDEVELTGTLTTKHPESTYGQPVMVIAEWDDGRGCMDHQNWTLAGCQVAEISEDEKDLFDHWLNQFPV